MKNEVNISHLYQKPETGEWVIQTNEDHCEGVAKLASEFAAEIGMPSCGYLLGFMHDRGKECQGFQDYIRRTSGYDETRREKESKDHSYVGGKILNDKMHGNAPFLSDIIASHHRGLYDYDELQTSVFGRMIPEGVGNTLPEVKLEGFPPKTKGKDLHHLTRMLFSCLTDADFLDTERFMNPEKISLRGNYSSMTELKSRLDTWMQRFNNMPDTELNRIRGEVQKICKEKSVLPSGFFELTVPTGGGKTIASMVWAINHALANNKRRVIIALPYTSIITQTAQTLREIFGDENVLEHHSVVVEREKTKDDEKNVSDRNKLATENWDIPIVVTTNVQLFESMFSNKPGKCRKLHSMCNSVLILDEVQKLPLSFLQPIVNSLETYVRLFGMSVLLCTASQPLLSGIYKGRGSSAHFQGIDKNITQIVGEELALHEKLRRVEISMPEKTMQIEEVAEAVASHPRVLCIVNTRKIANELFEILKDDESVIHLSRLMCPAHIQATINEIKRILKEEPDKPIKVISTQLIEAGVDIDFPVVYRQIDGLDSILQAAGRCNREGRLPKSVTHVFDLEGYSPSGKMGSTLDAMKEMLSLRPDSDWLSPSTIKEYFRVLYKKTASFDEKEVHSLTDNPGNIHFEEAAKKFHLIDETGIPVIVNYGNAENLVNTLRYAGPSRNLLRSLGMYSVTVRKYLFDEYVKNGLVEEPWEGFYYIPLKVQYDGRTGLKANNEYVEQTFII